MPPFDQVARLRFREAALLYSVNQPYLRFRKDRPDLANDCTIFTVLVRIGHYMIERMIAKENAKP